MDTNVQEEMRFPHLHDLLEDKRSMCIPNFGIHL
jgi:hypothetical protein